MIVDNGMTMGSDRIDWSAFPMVVAKKLAAERGPHGVVLKLQPEGYLQGGGGTYWPALTAEGIDVGGGPYGASGYERFLLHSDGHYEVLDWLDRVVDEGEVDQEDEQALRAEAKTFVERLGEREAQQRGFGFAVKRVAEGSAPATMPEHAAGPELGI